MAPAALAGAPCSSVTVNVHGDVNSIPHAEVAITNQRIVSSSNRPRMSTTDESVPLTAALEGVVDSDLPSYEDAVNYSPQTGIAIDVSITFTFASDILVIRFRNSYCLCVIPNPYLDTSW